VAVRSIGSKSAMLFVDEIEKGGCSLAVGQHCYCQSMSAEMVASSNQ